MKRILFICSQNKLRSPTAEQLFADWPGVEIASAGTNHDAENPVTGELLQWADLIVVMERMHRSKLQQRFRRFLNGQRILCLDIPDLYTFMDPSLVRLLKTKMTPYLPANSKALD